MCGIMGYLGPRSAQEVLLDGLTRLEYRGYDSAGIAVLGDEPGFTVTKAAGRVANLVATVAATNGAGETRSRRNRPPYAAVRGHQLGIGHTRWATHGSATDENAHPHLSADSRVAVVHNGILDNAGVLRAELVAKGVRLRSETDSEVLAHLVARSRADTLEDAVLEALSCVEGTYGLVVADLRHPDRLVVARNGSLMIVGFGEGEMVVASDVAALVRYTRQVVHLDDGEVGTLTRDAFRTVAREPRGDVDRRPVTVDWGTDDYEQGDHAHFMLKEIREQPDAVRRCLRDRIDDRFTTAHLGGLEMDSRELRGFRRVKVLGCGSAHLAGLFGAQFVEEVARIPADAEAASEFLNRNPVVDLDTLYVALSQSGETADTLGAVQEVRRRGGRVIGLVNVVGSSIARECDGGIYLHAGPEVAVASTKSLTNMCVGLALLGIRLGRGRDLQEASARRLLDGLRRLPGQIEEMLDREGDVHEVAQWLAKAGSVLFLGGVRAYPAAREGALKMKEISYLHAEACPTSELKHGALALVAPDLPTVALVPDDELLDRNLTALHEIAARSGPSVVVTHPGVPLDGLARHVITVPRNEPELDPLVMTVALQLLAYEVALVLDRDVDKPRNLAKSVPVE